MDSFIQEHGDKYVIPNPSDPSENFADKWAEFPERKDAFFQWLNRARLAFQPIVDLYSRKSISEALSPHIGTEIAKRTFDRIDRSGTSSLLRGATAASVASITSEPSFGDDPRIPTKPKGFA